MLNTNSLQALAKTPWGTSFVRPLYEGYAFSQIPSTVNKLLGKAAQGGLPQEAVGGNWGPYDAVVLFLLDGFGWEFFETYRSSYPFLNRLYEQGVVSKISSQFPSTTAAHMTSLYTALEVGQTGIYEWFYYEPLVDRMIAPILFSFAGDHGGATLLKEGISPRTIFPFETHFEQLAKQGVKSAVFHQEGIAHSPYSEALLQGAEIVSFRAFAEALNQISARLQKPLSAPTYFVCYFGDIDAAGHRHGIGSAPFKEAIHTCFSLFEEHLGLSSFPNKTALLITADHGMTEVNPKETLFLNEISPELNLAVKKNRSGLPLVPAGSCRDFFLHIEEDQLRATQDLLKAQLHSVAEVVLVQELVDLGFFGSAPVSQRLLDRVGNLVALPYKGHSLFWHFGKHRFEQHFVAAHGGLTPEEMHSVLSFWAP
jgi:hypothetical protein